VAGGGLMFELLVPLVGRLQGPEGIDGRAAIALFVVAAVYLAMVVMMLKVSTSIVTGWSVFGAGQSRDEADGQSRPAGETRRADPAAAATLTRSPSAPRRVVAGAAMAGNSGQPAGTGQSVSPADSRSRARPAQVMGIAQPSAYHAPRRASGIGSRFRQPYRLGAVR
jgi:type IV secretion system protein VirB6